MEYWPADLKFPHLKELYYAYNNVKDETLLIPAVVQNLDLNYLVITGNPFAANLQNSTLELLLFEKTMGELVNEN